MPPWAQTECERRTGTMEKRSTGRPISAILIVAASPASPPPTTIIFGMRAPPLEREAAPRGDDGDDNSQTEGAHGDGDGGRNPLRDALRPLPDGDAPGDQERPEAVTKVETGAEDPRGVEGENPRILQVDPDRLKGGRRRGER